MKYIVWSKLAHNPDALWADMPYAPRDLASCKQLVEYYESKWGNMYYYEVHPVGQTPNGMCDPCIIGHM